jgi:hypothetical protein
VHGARDDRAWVELVTRRIDSRTIRKESLVSRRPASVILATACPDPTPTTRYDGVRGGEDFGYYEPDLSTPQGSSVDGKGYSPDRRENQEEVQDDAVVRDFTGLFERAQEPFPAVGLDLPWYTAFGNVNIQLCPMNGWLLGR